MAEYSKRFYDSGGYHFILKEHEGMQLPPFVPGNPAEHLSAIRNLSARSDDIVIATYPKSGTHWLWEMVSMLVSGKAETPEVDVKHIEFREISEIKNLVSPRVLSTHLRQSRLPLDVINKKSKIIHLLRNPKDVAASMYPFLKNFTSIDYNGTWESFFSTHLKGDIVYGSWFDYVIEMEKFESDNPDYPIQRVYYEDLHTDCAGELKKIAEFLGQECNEDLHAAIVAKCTFANMKENKSAADTYLKKATNDGTHPLFRKGVVGDWKNTFTVAQSELMDAVYADRMTNSKYSFTYTM